MSLISVFFSIFYNFPSLWVIQVSFSAEYVRDVCAVVSDLSRTLLFLPSPSKKLYRNLNDYGKYAI